MLITRKGVTEEITEEDLQKFLSKNNYREEPYENGDSIIYSQLNHYIGLVVRNPGPAKEPEIEEKPKDDIPF